MYFNGGVSAGGEEHRGARIRGDRVDAHAVVRLHAAARRTRVRVERVQAAGRVAAEQQRAVHGPYTVRGKSTVLYSTKNTMNTPIIKFQNLCTCTGTVLVMYSTGRREGHTDDDFAGDFRGRRVVHIRRLGLLRDDVLVAAQRKVAIYTHTQTQYEHRISIKQKTVFKKYIRI